MNNQRYLLVVSGPSGCGKDTVVKKMMEKNENIQVAVSATTRSPRMGEAHGVDYHYVSRQKFEEYIQTDALLEHAEYVGNYYGTLKSEVDVRIANKITCVLVIEVQGAGAVKKLYPDCTTVFIKPPSMEELENRLRGRGSEDDAWIEKRMQRAKEELALAGEYDFCVINDSVELCADEILRIVAQRQTK